MTGTKLRPEQILTGVQIGDILILEDVGSNPALPAVDGSQLTGLDADTLGGFNSAFYRNASNLNAGTVAAARLTGTYNIDISGNAATATNASNASQLNSKSAAFYSSYDLAMFKSGKVNAASEEVTRFGVPRQCVIPASLTGSKASSRTVTAGAQTFTIKQDPGNITIGTVSFSGGASTGTFAGTGATLTTSDTLRIVATNADANQEDISIVIKAEVS